MLCSKWNVKGDPCFAVGGKANGGLNEKAFPSREVFSFGGVKITLGNALKDLRRGELSRLSCEDGGREKSKEGGTAKLLVQSTPSSSAGWFAEPK